MSARFIKRTDTQPAKPTTLCMDCDRIAGCPWMQLHRPVPGWKARRTYIIEPIDGSLRRGDARVKLVQSYLVRSCPLYIEMEVCVMQEKKQGIKKYTNRGVTTYRARCSQCGYKLPVYFGTLQETQTALLEAGWIVKASGEVLCADCRGKVENDERKS